MKKIAAVMALCIVGGAFPSFGVSNSLPLVSLITADAADSEGHKD